VALELIDPKATVKFIPECEKEAENPTTFHIKPETIPLSFKRQALFEANVESSADGAQVRKFKLGDDADIADYMVARISKIENVLKAGELVSLDDREGIRAFVVNPMENAYAIGMELFTFMLKTTRLTEDERKN